MPMPPDNRKRHRLTARQQAFIKEYLIDLNASRAGRAAGYSAFSAARMSTQNLDNPMIKAAIQEAMDQRAQRTEITADRVLQEIAVSAFYDPADIASQQMRGPEDIAALPESVRRCIVGWSWDRKGNFTLRLANKLDALDKLGRHLKLFVERHEHAGPDGGPIQQESKLDVSGLTVDQLRAVSAIRVPEAD